MFWKASKSGLTQSSPARSELLRFLTGSPDATAWESPELIRAELFSAERLEQHAESLAAAQRITRKPKAVQPLAVRLRDNSRVLLTSYRAVAKASGAGRALTPAADWLVDNYYVVEEQIRQIRDDLPPGYYRQLPKLADGPLAGYPRVFGIAWAFVAHTDSRLEAELLRRFVTAYQHVQPLTIGELWAVPITLRIVLVENLRRAAERIAAGLAARQQADDLADELLGVATPAAAALAGVLQKWDSAASSPTFAVQLLQRLRDQDPKVTPALTWLEGRVATQSTTADAIVRDEHQRQGASNVTLRNVITSMRGISELDWPELFESVSLVDSALRAGSRFAQMDFATRDRYRRNIEELARGSQRSELEVAQRVLLAAAGGGNERESDPGYHLIAGGRRTFEAGLGYRAPSGHWLGRIGPPLAIRAYIACIVGVAATFLGWPLLALSQDNTTGWLLAVLATFGLPPAIDAAMALVNLSVTSRFGAKILPALALRDGVPEHLRTLVVIPTLLTSQATLAEHLERLEIHHLASLDGDIAFALLSDWTDAAAANVPGDDALLDAATAGIARLNQLYSAAPASARFLLLHRRRIWDEVQGQWLGWERKRGKLHELNRLLRGATDTGFLGTDGLPPAVPPGVRYVITLDADTRLPRDTVRRLIGKMAHPLNRPRFDAATGRVVEGYSVLQPRVSLSLPMSREGSLYQRISSSASGIDPYAAAVSDVYQDLSGEGSYVGKGIYDVDAFEAALAGRVAADTLLSHDLFEGIFARAGLVSDIEVVEESPSRYDVAATRAHRWARGDWQLLPWLFGRGVADGDRRRKAIPLIGRWKMLDNLRRSLVAPFSVLALVVGWTLPLPAAALWTGFILATLATPALPPVLAGLLPKRSGISRRSHLRTLGMDAAMALAQIALSIVFLAHQAWLMCDAIVRTLFRLFVSHRLLLEWVTAAQAQVSRRLGLLGFYRRMSGAVAIGMALVVLAYLGYARTALVLPFVLLWVASPAIARWVSESERVATHLFVTAADTRALRLIARRAWRFFDTFVTAADHMLPPDNFQEDPRPVIAHRTSPTNLGLYLLSLVTARDFGWIGTLELVERLEATLAGMRRLERFRGHFYNWYDTQELRPLEPKYVSSVDSGNLAAHLIALANACSGLQAQHSLRPELFAGIEDELALTRESLSGLLDEGAARTTTRIRLDDALTALALLLHEIPSTSLELAAYMAALAPLAAAAVTAADALALERGDEASMAAAAWALATRKSIDGHLRDIALAPDGALERRLGELAETARTLSLEMRFDFLYDRDRKLLSIGYRVAEESLDPSCYDLLASEARLASFVAIANGDVPARHWFRLGRAVTPIHRGAALVSWSGSMFEYLMPSLVMGGPAGSLLEQTGRLIVWRQKDYCDGLQVPWGISESAYNARDVDCTYQYSGFGIPGLGLKRGLGASIVIAPYATALAAMVEPSLAMLNFTRLTHSGAQGRYGFYEALDYTPRHLPAGETFAIVRAYMAHHQGMTIVSLANALLNGLMRTRFHAEPRVQATELLLQERTPRDVAIAHLRAEEVVGGGKPHDSIPVTSRTTYSPHNAVPRTSLLSNGHYAVMLTEAGSGYSRWENLAITGWSGDVTAGAAQGSYVFLRDVDSGEVWSAGYRPTCIEADRYEVTFDEDKAQIVRRDGTLTTQLDIVVSAESAAEVRRISIANIGSTLREIELTSYAQLALAAPAADCALPGFSKPWVHTEFVAAVGALLATRPRGSPTDTEVWAAHLAVVEAQTTGELQFETDGTRFLGSTRELRSAIAVNTDAALSGTVGTVSEPIFSLRRRVRLAPGATARVAFWTVVAATRTEVLDLADKHHDSAAYDRAVTLAWTQAQVQLRHLGITADEANLFQRLASHLIYGDPALRPAADALQAHGICGDLPLVVIRIDAADDLDIALQLLRAFEYWRLKQLAVQLAILNEQAPPYTQDLQIALEKLIRTRRPASGTVGGAAQGGVLVLCSDSISSGTRALLLAAARVVLLSRRGNLAAQLERLEKLPAEPLQVASTSGSKRSNSFLTTL